MDNKKIYSLLGLSTRAGKLKSASDNTKKQFKDKCNYYNVPIAFFGDMESLGHAVGKGVRTSLVITDKGLAQSLLKNLLQED